MFAVGEAANRVEGGAGDHHEISEIIEKEDESDLRYDRDLKVLLEDHRYVTKFIMIISIVAMVCQIAFGVWSIIELGELGTWEDALLINWFHMLKIFLNIYVSKTFITRIKAK